MTKTIEQYRQEARELRERFAAAGGSRQRFRATVIRAIAGQRVTPELWVTVSRRITEQQEAYYRDGKSRQEAAREETEGKFDRHAKF